MHPIQTILFQQRQELVQGPLVTNLSNGNDLQVDKRNQIKL